MIALASGCLLFQMGNGERVPFSAEMISVELVGEAGELFDSEFVKEASYAVFHYFRHDLGRASVSVAEFSEALEKVLKGFALSAKTTYASAPRMVSSDLSQLACESGKGCELFFFPRLKEQMRQHLLAQPEVVHFSGLRSCVKQLIGVQRWTPKCQSLKEDILEFLRQCATVRTAGNELALVVE